MGGRKRARVLSSSSKIPIIVVSSFLIAALLVAAFTNRQVDQARDRIVDEKMRSLEAVASRVELRERARTATGGLQRRPRPQPRRHQRRDDEDPQDG